MNSPTKSYPCTKPVDVLIPIRDGATLIDQIIAAIALQTYQPQRVVFLDDGSQDDTFTRLETARERDILTPTEIMVLRAYQRIGVGAARNRLLEVSEGLIAWFDADDLWTPDAIERRLRTWLTLKFEDRGRTILYTDYWLHPGGRPENGRLMRMPEQLTVPILITPGDGPRTLQLQTAFGTREAFLLANGFDSSLSRSEDVDFMFRHLTVGGAFHRITGPPTAHYFQSFHGRDAGAIELAHDRLMQTWKEVFMRYETDTLLWRLDKRMRYTIFVYLANGDRDAANSILRDAWKQRHHPVIRRALKTRIAMLKSENALAPRRTLADLEIRRHDQEGGRSLRLERRADELSICFEAKDAIKIVLEWRDSDGQTITHRRVETSGAEQIVASVTKRDLLSAWLGGAVTLLVKGVARGRGATRVIRIVRSVEGVLTLSA